MSGRALASLVLLVVLAAALSAPAATTRPAPGPDSDGDGLPDEWELHGVTIDGGAGRRFIDLPAMGADPMKPDIFLQIDGMAGAAHDQRPSPAAIKLVVDAFANAPYVSPSGSVGITLHVDAGPNSALGEAGITWGPLSRARVLPWQKNLGTAAQGSYDWGAFDAIKNGPGGFTETGRGPVFHYAIFGCFHDLDDPLGWGASGNSRGIGGTDLVVTLCNFTDGVGTPREQAGTIMHELGHNLGLRHGGCDDTNSKAGYASVMNYAYQMEGLTRGGRHGVVDFSRGLEPVLDDGLLPEVGGLFATVGLEGQTDGRACVAPGPVRAGRSAREALPTDASAAGGASCADGAVFDDWKAIRLDLGDIGHLPSAHRRRR